MQLILKVRDGFLTESNLRDIAAITDQRKNDIVLDIVGFVERDATVRNDPDNTDGDHAQKQEDHAQKQEAALITLLHVMCVTIYDQQSRTALLHIRKDPLPVREIACLCHFYSVLTRTPRRQYR